MGSLLNNRESYRKYWWIFAEPRANFRPALRDIRRYIATSRTAKHRVFTFLTTDIVPDAKVVAIALEDGYFLGVLSSRVHVMWAMRTGGWLGVGNDSNYNHSDCFTKFPFPHPTPEQKAHIRDLGEQLDAHRKRQQGAHPDLTLTDMYNVLEKVRAAEPLDDKERDIHEKGLIAILQQLHDDLDRAVCDAYGWPHDLPDEEILQRLVDLNAHRAAEEARGHVRWLRPDYQAPEEARAQQTTLIDLPDDAQAVVQPTTQQPWPKKLKEQAQAVRGALAALDAPATLSQVAAAFKGRRTKKRLQQIEEILEMLVALGQAHIDDDGYVSD